MQSPKFNKKQKECYTTHWIVVLYVALVSVMSIANMEPEGVHNGKLKICIRGEKEIKLI